MHGTQPDRVNTAARRAVAGRCPILEAMTSPEFAITVTGSPGHPVVEVAGEIDYHWGLSLAERVDGLLPACRAT